MWDKTLKLNFTYNHSSSSIHYRKQGIHGFDVHPHNDNLLVLWGFSNRITLIDVASNLGFTLLGYYEGSKEVIILCEISSSGKFLISIDRSNAIRIWDFTEKFIIQVYHPVGLYGSICSLIRFPFKDNFLIGSRSKILFLSIKE